MSDPNNKFREFILNSVKTSGNKLTGEEAQVEALRRALETTTIDKPGHPWDYKEEEDEELEWW